MNPQQQQMAAANNRHDPNAQHNNVEYRQKILDALYVCARVHTHVRAEYPNNSSAFSAIHLIYKSISTPKKRKYRCSVRARKIINSAYVVCYR
jgi:hypothetical protein